ncbi:hypothetical protein [Kitasatospora sp. NBC_01300]|uniref:hypothetical protein n=1 Tax=Kitasatospora sp. NBC_01300 TaxID=2903574 RepID=UPI00352E5735|nr:hypothetical protein OG556_01005 [Kitasatospora sp. NBC_01300]WSK08237.1 hypothetical protein OG556_32715 [Kitasatospora sp. NBC_01300]
MDGNARQAAVAALAELGRGRDYRDRADAGRALAGFAELPEACGPLLALVLDADDTFVTRATTQALLRRNDPAGLTVVASAPAVADDNHGDWIHTAVVDVFGVFADDRDDALRLCEELSRAADGRVALGAGRLRDSLAGIDPALGPAAARDGR